MGRRGYPPEFRRRVVDLVEADRTITDVARDLDISEQSIYRWRRQALIDKGLVAGTTSAESAELAVAHRRIAQLETKLAIAMTVAEQLKDHTDPKVGSRRSR